MPKDYSGDCATDRGRLGRGGARQLLSLNKFPDFRNLRMLSARLSFANFAVELGDLSGQELLSLRDLAAKSALGEI
jgi:hypothetical protein